MPFNYDALDGPSRGKLDKMASILMEDYRENSRILEMKYAEWA
jgi:hypothetical protein